MPVTVPSAWLMLASAKARASPKSATLTTPSRVTRMFSGFTSRWTMPCAWACPSAARTWVVTSTTCAGSSRPCSASMLRKLLPETYSMTMK